eukprot:TRINITY_DN110352_c0_g1_i1.p1 TRINITY_DN110352_c0_g1~~TRINITY_DN110352_c0_g1_i1.p1  ORF type:complete len:377 (+),score=34.82 TRINITY_DN110352_c0_g1_i1:87-1217(+)
MDVLDSVPSASGSPKSNVSLPGDSREICDGQSFLNEISNVARHYDVPCCFIALESSEGLHLKARYGLDHVGKFVPHPNSGELMCRHHINRALPIIVEDASVCKRFKDDPLVVAGIRFYVGAPIMITNSTCVGTLCIADFKPWPGFGLLDTPALEHHASQLGKLLMVASTRRTLTWEAWTVGSLPNLNSTSWNFLEGTPSQDLPDSLSDSSDCEADSFDVREAQLMEIVKGVAMHYRVPCSFIALDTPEGMHIKAGFGLWNSLKFLPHPTTGKLMCRSTINRPVPIIIADAASAATVRDDPLVAGDQGARFYAGAPIIAGGAILGTLCIIDIEPRLDFDLGIAKELEASAHEISQLLQSTSIESLLVRDSENADEEI